MPGPGGSSARQGLRRYKRWIASNQGLHLSPLGRDDLEGGSFEPDLVTTLGYLSLLTRTCRYSAAPSTTHTFCPPNPNEFEIACFTLAALATFGTQSTGSAGSGMS